MVVRMLSVLFFSFCFCLFVFSSFVVSCSKAKQMLVKWFGKLAQHRSKKLHPKNSYIVSWPSTDHDHEGTISF